MQHLDEGTIHAWLDGELSPDEASNVAAHASACPECAAMVAEARGLVAASTRILTALDEVPGSVIPSVPDIAPAQTVRRRWYQRTDVRAAAALLLVAGTSLVVVQRGANSSASRAMLATDDKGQATPAAGAATPESRTFAAPLRKEEAKSGFAVPRDQTAQANAMADAQPRRLQARDESQLLKEEAAKSRAADVASVLAAPPISVARVGAAPPMVTAPAEGRTGANAPGVVQGRVIDKQSGKGVSQAQVVIEGTSLDAATDKDGNFRITNVPPGDQRLRVRRIGYEAAAIPLSKESRDAKGATVALTPSQVALAEVVVTSAENAPTVATAGAAVSKAVAEAPLRVVRADSTGGVRRITYEVSKGVEVTLTESPVQTALERDAVRQKVAAPQSAVAPADARQRENVLSGRAAGAVASAATVAPNSITWTERGRKFVLTGRLATKDLEAIKARLIKMKR
ncbi:MAG: carboxypeptidase-like regulatory domain-containing protein [Gemmatimonadaceae bacterium]